MARYITTFYLEIGVAVPVEADSEVLAVQQAEEVVEQRLGSLLELEGATLKHYTVQAFRKEKK